MHNKKKTHTRSWIQIDLSEEIPISITLFEITQVKSYVDFMCMGESPTPVKSQRSGDLQQYWSRSCGTPQYLHSCTSYLDSLDFSHQILPSEETSKVGGCRLILVCSC